MLPTIAGMVDRITAKEMLSASSRINYECIIEDILRTAPIADC